MKYTYDKTEEVYKGGDWEIEKVGGFVTSRHYWAKNEKKNINFWQFKLAECKDLIEKLEINPQLKIDDLYLKSLY